MARSWHYPRWRRLLMQGVMWLILGATVGFAALLNHQVRQSHRIELAGEEQHGNLVVRLPSGWTVAAPDADAGTVAQAVEPGTNARTVSIARYPLGELISPEEFLFRQPVLAGAEQESLHLSPATIAGRPGILVAAQFDGGVIAGRPPRKLVRIATVLPSRVALAVQLEGSGSLSEMDLRLALEVAQALDVTDQTWLDESARAIELPDGTSLPVPQEFSAVVNTDPNRISRWMLLSTADGRWACAEIVGCFWSDAGGEPAIETLRTMLLPHGQEWHDARITRDSPSTLIWRIQPRRESDFPRRAYFLAGDNGRAVLALFRAGLDNASLIEPAWQQIRRGVHFGPAIDLAALSSAGAEAARRLRGLGLADLIPTRAPQWWLWYRDSADTFVGYSHFEYDARNLWRATLGASWKGAGGSSELLHRFDSDTSMQAYDSLLQRFSTESDLERSLVKTFERSLHADQGQLRVVLERAGPGRQIKQPAQFLPGGWLSQLMGQFRDRALLLRTDALFGCEDFAPVLPMTLLLTPADQEELPPQQRGKWDWCMNVQVNGSSEVMRWHFSADGQLQQIDHADGLHRMRSDQSTIESFASETGAYSPTDNQER